MTQAVLLLDHKGYTERWRTMIDAAHPLGIPVFSVSTADQADVGTALRTTVPENWLPLLPHTNRYWWKPDAIALSAIQEFNIVADFYWIIEYDCAASVERWQALLQDPVSSEFDGVFICPRTREQTLWNPLWKHEGTDDRATHVHIQAVHGMSRRAVNWCTETAESKRETLCELCTASTIVANGGKIGSINKNTTHGNSQTFKTSSDRVLFNPEYINHPLKYNGYGISLP